MGYYDTSYPPSLWDGSVTPSGSATAGMPGTWLPAGSTPPANVVALQNGNVTAIPASPWTIGQYVQTGTAGAPGEATWTGSAWVGGRSPGAATFRRAAQEATATGDTPATADTPATGDVGG